MSCLMAVRRPGTAYKPYFQNRIGEIQRNLGKLEHKVNVVEQPLKIAGPENPADIGTRGKAKLEDIGPASLWQLGPDFLCRERELWGLEVPEEVSGAVPDSEIRQKALVGAVGHQVQDRLETLLGTLLQRKGSFIDVVSVLARVLAGMGSGQPGNSRETELAVKSLPGPGACRAAYKLILFWE